MSIHSKAKESIEACEDPDPEFRRIMTSIAASGAVAAAVNASQVCCFTSLCDFSTCTFEIVLLSDFLQTNFVANNDD